MRTSACVIVGSPVPVNHRVPAWGFAQDCRTGTSPSRQKICTINCMYGKKSRILYRRAGCVQIERKKHVSVSLPVEIYEAFFGEIFIVANATGVVFFATRSLKYHKKEMAQCSLPAKHIRACNEDIPRRQPFSCQAASD